MTAYKFTSKHQLRDILNNVEGVQKSNIDEYSWGHLNEKKLYKPPYQPKNGRIWKSSKPRKSPVKDSELLAGVTFTSPATPRTTALDDDMRDALYEFSVGTMGSVPVLPGIKSKVSPRPEKIEEYRRDTSDLANISGSNQPRHGSAKSVYSQIEDGILVEELPNQEIMMKSPRSGPAYHMPKRLKSPDDKYDSLTDLTQALDADGYLTLKHSFLPSFKSGVTKADQFNKLRYFEDRVLKKQECRERKVLSGVRAVQHLERRLEEDLEMLNLNGMGPNFHKLQVFSNHFEDLIDETPTFGYMLRCIKSEYDNYITKLLDSQTPMRSRQLRDQVQQMSARGTSRPQDLDAAKQRVTDLEGEAQDLIAENERLRQQVKEEEEWLANAPIPEPPMIPTVSMFVDDSPVELADEIEHGKALILEKLDALTDLRRKLRQEHVPLTVCTHLEQCIKETEIEVQKLLKQNEYFERSNNEMETELKESIQDADTSERDARRIWKKVNSLKGLPRVNLTKDEGKPEDSDDEEDDETKWNWYIS